MRRPRHPHKLHGWAGIVLRALSTIDIVLGGRNSRAAGLPMYTGLPMYKYLGAFLRGRLPLMCGSLSTCRMTRFLTSAASSTRTPKPEIARCPSPISPD